MRWSIAVTTGVREREAREREGKGGNSVAVMMTAREREGKGEGAEWRNTQLYQTAGLAPTTAIWGMVSWKAAAAATIDKNRNIIPLKKKKYIYIYINKTCEHWKV
jgi:hypothetical protein